MPPGGPSTSQRLSAIARAVGGVPRNLPVPNPFADRSLHGAVGGKVVMVTGASSGIGRALSLRLGRAGATVLLVARTPGKLDAVRAEIEELGGTAHVHPCDLTDTAEVERTAAEALAEHGRVDILVNNAGRSIRRSIANSYDRLHDFERTIQLNYLGAVALILQVLPGMRERRSGQIVNVSPMGLQVNTPRFSAYLASKAALDAFSRSIASEIVDDGVTISTVLMPLVRTPMIEPSGVYRNVPSLSPNEAATMIAKAIVNQPKKQSTTTGRIAEITYGAAPKVQDAVVNAAFKLMPGSGERRDDDRDR
jgi:NAD(P)-dependent dehydrogenase (short-subunit alcohol dehydrogenase family)